MNLFQKLHRRNNISSKLKQNGNKYFNWYCHGKYEPGRTKVMVCPEVFGNPLVIQTDILGHCPIQREGLFVPFPCEAGGGPWQPALLYETDICANALMSESTFLCGLK